MLVWQAHNGKIESAAFAPNGQLLATATGGTRSPYLWNATNGELARKLGGASGAVKSVCFAPDAPVFAAGTAESITLWNADTWEVFGELKIRHARELAFGRGAAPVLVASNTDGVRYWTDATVATEGAPRASDGTFGNLRNLAAVHLTADGRFLVTSTHASAKLWDTDTHRAVQVLRNKTYPTRGEARFSPDGRRVAISYGKWVEVWPVPDVGSEPQAKQPLLKIAAGQGRSPLIWAVSWTADGRAVVTAGNDECVRLWDASTGVELRSFDWKIGKLYSIALSPDGLTCAAGGAKGQIVVWDMDV